MIPYIGTHRFEAIFYIHSPFLDSVKEMFSDIWIEKHNNFIFISGFWCSLSCKSKLRLLCSWSQILAVRFFFRDNCKESNDWSVKKESKRRVWLLLYSSSLVMRKRKSHSQRVFLEPMPVRALLNACFTRMCSRVC